VVVVERVRLHTGFKMARHAKKLFKNPAKMPPEKRKMLTDKTNKAFPFIHSHMFSTTSWARDCSRSQIFHTLFSNITLAIRIRIACSGT